MCVGVGELCGTSVGVGVGECTGVLVGVGDGPTVGVGVGSTSIEKTSLQFTSVACGVTCGTVGATGCWLFSFTDVIYAATPIPAVMRVTSNRYQYFFKNDIRLSPCSACVYLAFNDEICNSFRNGVFQCVLTTSVLFRCLCPGASIDTESGFFRRHATLDR